MSGEAKSGVPKRKAAAAKRRYNSMHMCGWHNELKGGMDGGPSCIGSICTAAFVSEAQK